MGRHDCLTPPPPTPQVSGKRAAVESDQEKVSTSELLLEDYLKRLGAVQAHLQARPNARLMTPEPPLTTTAASGAILSPVRCCCRCAVSLLVLVCAVVVLEVASVSYRNRGREETRDDRKVGTPPLFLGWFDPSLACRISSVCFFCHG